MSMSMSMDGGIAYTGASKHELQERKQQARPHSVTRIVNFISWLT